MPIRRRAWLSREGWYFLAVLSFIVAGSVLKGINLLVVLCGMMFAMLVINWRLVMASLAGLIVRRKPPRQVCAGEPVTVEIGIENPRWWMSSWLIRVEDWVEREDGPRGTGARGQKTEDRERSAYVRWIHWLSPRRILRWNATRAEAVVAHVPARGSATGTYRIVLNRRGRYRLGPLRVSTRFPLGLVRGQFLLPARAEMLVAPRIGHLSPQWLEVLESDLVGDERRHPQRGMAEGDYYGLRPWQSGDSMRWIHWRTTARTGRPMVRQFERRSNRDVALLLDPWLPRQPLERDQGLLELAISLAATAIADLTSRGHSRLTFAVAGDPPQCWSGPASMMFCEDLHARLAIVPPSRQANLGPALARVLEEAPAGTRLVIISPRSADAAGSAEGAVELALDPSEVCWIDVADPQLVTLFSVE